MKISTKIKKITPVDFDPFASGPIVNVIPSIEPQREIFSSYVVGGEDANRSYNQSVSLHLNGPLNQFAMERALKSLIERHELLRSNFSSDGTQICIYKELPLNFVIHDLVAKTPDERKRVIEQVTKQDAQTSFDMLNGPLFRTILFKLSPSEHHLTITAHHIICDGWSLGVIMQDLGRFYTCYAKNEESDLDEVPEFSKYAEQQINFTKSEIYRKTEQYWLDQYKAEIPVLELPTDLQRPAERTYNSRNLRFELSSELVSGIRKTGADTGSSLATTLITSFQIFLHRLTGQDSVVVGIPASGQSASNNHGLVGNCVNLLPIKSTIEENSSFSAFLQKQKRNILDAYDHQFFTYGSLLKKLPIRRDPSRIPLVPVVLNVDLGLDSGVSFFNLQHILISNPKVYESFEIFLNVSGSEHSVVLEWIYNTQLFSAAAIEQMMEEFKLVLETIATNPSVPVREIPLLRFENAFEWQKKWIDEPVSYPADLPVHHLIAVQAEKNPNKIAVYYNDTTLTYHQLNTTANQLAALLRVRGVQAGDRIGLSIDRSEKTIITLLAILKTGACYIPLDPEYPKDRIEFMLQDSGARILMTSAKYRGYFKSDAEEIVIDDAWLHLHNYSDSEYFLHVAPKALAYILYTSGSTGKPKGVQISHKNLINFLLSMQQIIPVAENDSLLAVTTISFDISGLELYLPLISCASLIIANTETTRDGNLLLDMVKIVRPTIMQATPSTWQMLLSCGWDTGIPVEKILCGGEALSRELAKNLLMRCSSLINVYGPTETTIWSTYKKMSNVDDIDIITIGRPIANTQVFILDEKGKPVPANFAGEIYIAGDGVARGYLNRPELSTERFVENPFSADPADKMYRTGDLGKFLPDGEIQCLGRIDHQVKVRGHRIEPEEIEHCLVNEPDIEQAVVIAREDKPGDQRLVAYIVTTVGNIGTDMVSINTWKQSLKNALPAYMVPNDFVILSSLPLTPNGKIDRKSLPAPKTQSLADTPLHTAPRSRIEKLVADTWSRLLGIEKISITDDFFELGGHSLIAAQVMSVLAKDTGKKLPLTSLFKYPVLENFASLFSDEVKEPLIVKKRTDQRSSAISSQKIYVPAIEPQTEIWVSCLIGGDDANRSYNLSMSEKLSGELNRSALERALQDLVDRHESLRSTFSTDGKDICIAPYRKADIYFEDISSWNGPDQQGFIASYLEKNASTSYDLVKGPLFRIALFKTDHKEHFFTFEVHHIICDGWSLGILMQELSKLYSAYVNEKQLVLPDAPKFSKYANEQLEFSSSVEYSDIESYWIDQFKHSAPLMELPIDFPRPATRTYKSRRDDYAMNTELIDHISRIGVQASTSFPITLRAAFEIYLHLLTGQDDIVVGIPTAGQLATGNYELVGHCANLLPLRTKVNSESSFNDYLQQRKVEILEAYDHQQYTFGSLLKHLNLARDRSRVPLVPIVFNVEGGMDEGVNFAGLKHEMIFNPREFETFEIFLNMGGTQQTPTLQWSYNTQLFEASTIRQMMEDFEYVLGQLIKDPSVQIKDLVLKSFLGAIDQQNKSNNTKVIYQKDKSLPALITEQAKLSANKTAIRYQNHNISYGDMNSSANQLALLLKENGIGRGDTVGLLMDRSHQMVISLLAIMKSGASYVPLDPEFPKERIRFMLSDSAAKVLLLSEKYKGLFESNATEITIEEAWLKLPQYSTENLELKIEPEDIVYTLYTSGSTGKPKGVQIYHHSLVNFLNSMQKLLSVNAEDRLLAVTTISFDISGLELYLPLITGSTVLMIGADAARDGNILLDNIRTLKPSIMQATPSTWRIMIDSGWKSDLAIKTICCGGEALSRDLADSLMERCQSLFNLYGPTETTVWSTAKKISKNDELITIGKPIDNTQVYILNEQGKPVPANFTGEIYIGGDGVAKGYLNRSGLTDEKFVENPFVPQKGLKMYRTGDLGKYLTNGEIQCLGRIDHQVKIRGHRIELGEIEYALSKQKEIVQSVVVAREDRAGDQRLVAYLVCNTAESPDQKKIGFWRQELKDSLPYYMIPNDFVVLPSLPLTPNGKIDRLALPAPQKSTETATREIVAPSTAEEKMIAEVWKEILAADEISIDDDFFESGGHSLIAVKMLSRLEKATGIRLPLAVLFEHSTIRKLGSMLHLNDQTVGWHCLVPIKPSGNKMPLYMVHGAGGSVPFFNRKVETLHPDQPIYGLQARGLDGKQEILETIPELASAYIAEILEQNPSGPYALAGYSFGGYVAFEMAQQLTRMGKEVKMLAIFDTHAENATVNDSFFKRIYKGTRMFLRSSLYTMKALVTNPKVQVEYERGELKKLLRDPYFKFRNLIGKKKVDYFYYKRQIEKTNLRAKSKYQLTPYNGTIDLFRAKIRTYYLDDFEYLGWKPFALKGVRVHEIPGEHNKIFLPPSDTGFAEVLQKCLDEAVSGKQIKDVPMPKSVLKAV